MDCKVLVALASALPPLTERKMKLCVIVGSTEGEWKDEEEGVKRYYPTRFVPTGIVEPPQLYATGAEVYVEDTEIAKLAYEQHLEGKAIGGFLYRSPGCNPQTIVTQCGTTATFVKTMTKGGEMWFACHRRGDVFGMYYNDFVAACYRDGQLVALVEETIVPPCRTTEPAVATTTAVV